jgi:hypothetical protein
MKTPRLAGLIILAILGSRCVNPNAMPREDGAADSSPAATAGGDGPSSPPVPTTPVAGSAPADPCTAVGARRCANGPVVQACAAAGAWVPTEICESTCVAGACQGPCQARRIHCGPHETPEVCNDEGAWLQGPACPDACTGQGQCSGVCRPGSRICGADNLTLLVCDLNGAWVARPPCRTGCVEGACAGPCAAGDRKCGVNGLPAHCSSLGIWESEAACATRCLGAGLCQDCIAGAKSCADDKKTPRTCNSTGRWTLDPSPCAVACAGAGQCGVCEAGASQCAGNSPQECGPDGQWRAPGSACLHSCIDGRCSRVCAANENRCETNVAQRCSADGQTWNDDQRCPFGCDDGAPICKPDNCKESDLACKGRGSSCTADNQCSNNSCILGRCCTGLCKSTGLVVADPSDCASNSAQACEYCCPDSLSCATTRYCGVGVICGRQLVCY